MKEELERTQRNSIITPFLVGGLLGAGIALLLAPKSGKELRKDIKDTASNVNEKVTGTLEKGRNLYEESTVAVKNAIEAGKMAYIQERDKQRAA